MADVEAEESAATGEAAVIAFVQRHCWTNRTVAAARGLSAAGEHALVWLVLGTAGSIVDRDRRSMWRSLAVTALTAHAAAVVTKRVVRRPRPNDSRVRVGVGTPSALSFPSAHACSTAAAAVVLAPVVGVPAAVATVGAMGFSRVLLGVHYPSDVAAGVALGSGIAVGLRRMRRNLP